jgi:hypothetical protein
VVTETALEPTINVYVAIAEVDVTLNVMASPSQKVEDDADDAKAVDVKLIIGLSTI